MRRQLILVSILLSIAIAGEARQRSARINAILPTFGPPGTTVTIRGAGFSGFESGAWIKETASEQPPGAVEFNGSPGEIVFWQDDLITVIVPIGATTGPVRVINPGAKVAITGASFEVPYSQPSVTPSRPTPAASSGASSVGADDGTAEGFINHGNLFYQKKDYRSAISQYDRALAVQPNSVDALTWKGVAYSRLGMYPEAISVVNQIVAIAPGNSGAYVSLSWYYSLSDQYQAASDAARMAIKAAPENYMGYTNLCRAYNDMERYQDALTACAQALNLKPGDGETSFYMGRAYLRLNQAARATPLFQKAVQGLIDFTKERPDDPDAYYLLGNAYSETKQDEQAVRSYLKAVELKPRFPQARYNLGVLLHILGRDRDALEQQEQLRLIDPMRAARLLQIVKGR